MKVHYLLDERIRNNHSKIINNEVTYLNPSLLQRHNFYVKNRTSFSKVLCFGNLAPSLKLDVEVYTYFHQRIFLNVPESFSIKQSFNFKLKSYLFRYFLRNTNYILLQTESVKEELLKKINHIKSDKVLVVPFYQNMQNQNLKKIKNSFLYVSSGSPHKNHDLLLNAFKTFYDIHKKGVLTVTIDSMHTNLFEKVKNLIKMGYPIVNIGLVSRQELASYYSQAEYIIYPSLSESFGLGILEGLDTNCKIIGSNLPYLHAVCGPTMSFNPYSVSEIADCFAIAINNNMKKTRQKVFNEIDSLISLLK
ncbi:glycosyltransferase [Psychroflexus salinarum]|uniref:Glycosyltransferase n=1 Tax=Psychroflexus salinarum TaxID=546024 RepID=A0ABW3GLV1_9FLAO